MSVHAAYIVEEAGGAVVPAEVHDELSPAVLLDVESQWGPFRTGLRQRLAEANVPPANWPQSLHWDWGNKSLFLSLFKQADAYRVFGVRRQAAWEGAMVTVLGETVARLAPDCGKPAVTLDYLEVAPWNWSVPPPVGQVRKYRGVGPVLLNAAVSQSRAEGCEGRIGLHALPQAEAFYLGQEFQFVEYDEAKKMNYYELTAEAAQRFGRG